MTAASRRPHRDALGIHALSSLEDGRPVRVVVTERHVEHSGEPTRRDLREALITFMGHEWGNEWAGRREAIGAKGG